jgi:hypothetical protein
MRRIKVAGRRSRGPSSSLVSGRAVWSGGKPGGTKPLVRTKGQKTVSDAVIEDRR